MRTNRSKFSSVLRAFCAVLGIAIALGPSAAPAAAKDVVKVGLLRVPQTTMVAIDKGFFAKEDIDAQVVFFQSGAELVPSLATGQIDVASTSAGAALFNALSQGATMKIVADHWVAAPNSPSGDTQFISVRKDLITSGAYKGPRDAKGMTIAVTARGQISDLVLRVFLERGGLTESDVKIVTLPYPEMLAALGNKAVDIASAIEPYVTLSELDGSSKRVVSESALLPGVVQAVTMYGDGLAQKNRPLGMRYMRAMTQANRYIRRQLQTPAGRTELAAIYQKYIPLKDPSLYEHIGIGNGLDNLAVDIDGPFGLRYEETQFAKAGLVQTPPDIRKAVDNSFANAAAAAK